MNHTLVHALVGALALCGASAASAEKAAAPADKPHVDLHRYQTSTYSIYLPGGWKTEVVVAPKDGMSEHVISSPNRNQKAYVRVGALRDDPLKGLWLRYVEEFLGKRLGKIHVQSYSEMPANETTGVAFGAVYGVGRRNTTAQLYKFTVIAVRNVLRGRVLYAAVGATGDRWRELAQHMPLILRSINLK